MDLQQQQFLQNQSNNLSGAVGGGGGGMGALGALLLLVCIFLVIPLLFIAPYYDQVIFATTDYLGVNPRNSIVPLTVMVLALITATGAYFIGRSKPNHWKIYNFVKRAIRIAIIFLSAIVFLGGGLHWLVQAQGFNV